ncbi:RNA 2',3'-cyclic phosphodiesterase [Egicoccus sp. AB-alg2]|uniref:RNA 2',3'-cyclic phosphodiesterase n=1 Tax=Egicoccus sp. AB-alg2 TaxID=3242693 RepID=UPI00359EEE14
MRLFVALPIPADLRTALDTAVQPLRDRASEGLSWTRAEGWHLTLAFLGTVPDDRVDTVVAVLGAVAGGADAIDLASGAVGRFRRDVLWLGVDDEPAGAVARLGEQVQQALEAADLPVQRRDVHAHVTVARSRRRAVDRSLVDRLEVPEVRWRATSLQLWSSRLGKGPARYAVEHDAPLGGRYPTW